MNSKITLSLFKEALYCLDSELSGVQNLPVIIRAVGGFALLYHEIRLSGYTVDIDSVTEDFPQEVMKCIEKIANKFDFPTDWLNNYNVLDNDVEAIEMMIDPDWIQIYPDLQNIEIYVADLNTLLRSKLLASDSVQESGRLQDFPDLVTIFRKLGCFTLDSIILHCNSLDLDLKVMYPFVLQQLKNLFISRKNKPLLPL